jgi:thiol-disulfide isomerase/thioredoxin
MERVQSVKASTAPRTPESFCDRQHPGAAAPLLNLPALIDVSSEKPARISTRGRWTWINIWATFCLPCLREMDTLAAWRERLADSGTPADLVFVSVDEGMDEVGRYLAKNPKISRMPSYLATDHPALEAAIKPLGLGSLDSIPMHILAAPDGTVRCVRAGALNSDDYPLVKGLMTAR